MASRHPGTLRTVHSFFVGGAHKVLDGLPVQRRSMVLNGAPREVNPNGTHTYGQMYVQEFRLQQPKYRIPVVLWHGGGMTGATWESTPDGRQGWLWRFLEAGYDVMVCDAVERGRSAFAMHPHIYDEPPIFRTREEGWTTFRMGLAYAGDTAKRHVFEAQQFPVDFFDEFTKSWVPRWPGHEDMILVAYEALVERLGQCVIVAHSQGAGFAAEIARRQPGHVAAVVAVEPGGMPAEGAAQALSPHLVVWGDYIQASGTHWMRYRQQADSYFDSIRQHAAVSLLDLPKTGVRGNSHFPMMDANSDQIFDLVEGWIGRVQEDSRNEVAQEPAREIRRSSIELS